MGTLDGRILPDLCGRSPEQPDTASGSGADAVKAGATVESLLIWGLHLGHRGSSSNGYTMLYVRSFDRGSYPFQVCLRYLILWLCSEYGTISLVPIPRVAASTALETH